MNKIIIVDNDPGVLHMLEYLIMSTLSKKYAMNIHTFTDPSLALDHLQGCAVVISDIKMYPIDGIEFIRLAWSKNYSKPVLVYSAFADKDTEIDLRRLHADFQDKKIESVFHKSELTRLMLAIERHLKPRC